MSAIVIALIAIFMLIAVFGGIFLCFHFSARASRGGVQPPPGSRRRGAPPFEGIERDARR